MTNLTDKQRAALEALSKVMNKHNIWFTEQKGFIFLIIDGLAINGRTHINHKHVVNMTELLEQDKTE